MRIKASVWRVVTVACAGVASLLFVSTGVASADTGPLSVDLTTCPQLSVGSTGPCVTALQQDLQYMGDQNITAVDGVYGPQTQAAVSNFQAGYGMNSTGVADPQTLSTLAQDVQDSQAAQSGPPDPLGEFTNDLCDNIPGGGFADLCKSFWDMPLW